MGSRNHTSGVGFEPRLLGQRSLGAVLAGQRQSGADNRFAIYVRPLGDGFHEVKNLCNDTPYKVGSAVGSATFKPGAEVLLGSNAGTPGEVIIGLGPPGRRGGSEFSIQAQVRSFRLGVQAQSVCPTLITGKSYLAISALDGVLSAWRYADGTFQEELAAFDYGALGLPNPSSFPAWQRVHALGDVVVYQGRQGLRDWIMTWDVAANELHALDLTDDIPETGEPVWPGGSFIYFLSGGVARLQLYKVAIGAEGVIDEPSARVGAELVEGTSNLAVSSVLCCASSTDFQAPSFWLEDDSPRVCYLDGAAWNLGEGREVITISNSTPGVPCLSGAYSLRGTFVGGDFALPNLALLPAAPGSPEILALPPDWDLSGSMIQAVSPAGNQVAILNFWLDGEEESEEHSWLYRATLRAQTPPTGCTPPRIAVEAGPNGFAPTAMLPRD